MINTPTELEFYIVALIALVGGILILRTYKPNINFQSSLFRVSGIILILFGIIGLSLGFMMLVATNSYNL